MKKYPVRTIKIVHDELRGDEYRLLAGYFRLIGVFVCDCTARGELSVNTEYDAVLRVSENVTECVIVGNEDNGVFDIPVLSLQESKEKKAGYLLDLLERVFFAYEKTWEQEALKKIADIYIEHSLLKYIYSINYFYREEKVIKESFRELAESYNALTIWEQSLGKESKYSLYARIDMARILNELCNMSGWERPFDTAKLVAGTQKIIGIDNAFYNVYVLNGFLCDIDNRYRSDVQFYYQKALEMIGGKPYASYVHYRLGRYYEKKLDDKKKALEQYVNAYEANHQHYRSIYKIALSYKAEQKYDEACILYQKIIDILFFKTEKNYLQPIEYEYLFKTYTNMGDIYKIYLHSFNKAAYCFEKGIEIIEKLSKEKNEFFESMYGTEKGDYRDFILKRLDKKKMYRELIDIYTELKDENKLQEYLKNV